MDRQEAIIFSRRWEGRGKERQDTQTFWQEFFQKVLEVPDPYDYAVFEKPVRVSGSYNGPKVGDRAPSDQMQLSIPSAPSRKKSTDKSIDVYIPSAKALIEQKSLGVSLDERLQQSDGAMLTPFEQGLRYNNGLPYREKVRFIVTCNFEAIRIYDLDYQDTLLGDRFTEIKLSEVPDNLGVFDFLVREHKEEITKQKDLSLEAANLMSKLKSQLQEEFDLYRLPDQDLTVLMVRLLFCMYAEDAGLFQPSQFRDYLKDKIPDQQTGQFNRALRELFAVLATPVEDRRMVSGELVAFPYVNGGLFAEPIEIPWFDADSKHTLLQECCTFQWSKISPVLFGSLFESVLSRKERHEGGMHYTSVENIRKATKPLFLEELDLELRRAGNNKARLRELQERLASLHWFDPACGSGNFLTQTYIDVRRMENTILQRLVDPYSTGQTALDVAADTTPRVSINQFHGIEVNDFAVHVAETAMQIASHQMDVETSAVLQKKIDSLPLTKQTGIVCANALRIDWNDVLPAEECDYILGNPPFLGARNQSRKQKDELREALGGAKNSGNADYVAGWFAKAADYVGDERIRCAFVATNSICQGEQAAIIWKPIFDKGLRIDFAHDTFRWSSEASDQAHVFCVIVGFSKLGPEGGSLRLFHHEGPDAEAEELHPKRLNAYLCDAPDVFVWNRNKPICNAPKIGIGSQPIDGGNYLFKETEKNEFVASEPLAEKYFHPWLGSEEFINGKKRWVLWLGDATQTDLKQMPHSRERIDSVRQFRLASKRAQTRKAAATPNHFGTEIIPESTSIIIPKVSSERRHYVPMGFIGPETLCSDLVFLIPNASPYHFGVLHSQMHNAWMRRVCGRLESRYRYSGGVVYNNFPWPGASAGSLDAPVEKLVDSKKREAVEAAAQAILDARALYPEFTLADMYDPKIDYLFPELTKAHKELDLAVERAYGVRFNGDEERMVSHLIGVYAEIAGIS